MFRTILISVVTLMHVYVFWRVATVPFVIHYIPRKILVSSGIILWLGFFLAATVGHGGFGRIAWLLEWFGMNWMAILFLIFVSILAVDVITGFGFLFSQLAPALRGLALIAGLALSITALIQGLRPPVIINYKVTIPGLPAEMDGKSIVVMSDLHIGMLIGKNWFKARVKQVQELKPDLIALVGDIFEIHGVPDHTLIPILKGLSAPLGVWAVPGNHEAHGSLNENISLFEQAGVHVLLNRWAEIRPGLIIAGVGYDHTGRGSEKNSNSIQKALKDRPPGTTIFLSHAPRQAQAAAAAGVNLMLCGHTHGGQIWPFGYLVRYFYPLFAGSYDVNGMTVIVCRGTGTWGPRMRLWRRGEILKIMLQKK